MTRFSIDARAAAVLGAAVLTLLAAAGCGHQQPPAPAFPPGALTEYYPENTGGVLTLNVRQVLDSPTGKQHLQEQFKKIIRRGEAAHPWMGLLGMDAAKDVDRLQVLYCAGDLGRPLWLVRGRFDPKRFQVGPNKLRETTEGRYHLYEYPAGAGTTLALAGDTLLACDDRARVVNALNHASGQPPKAPPDPRLVQLLEKVDRKQEMWAAVDFGKLGPSGEPKLFVMRLLLDPILHHARTVRGGLTVADKVQVDFTFTTRDEAAAGMLKTAIENERDLVKGTLDLGLTGNIEKDLLPLARLLAAARVSREGDAVRLRGELPADQLGQ